MTTLDYAELKNRTVLLSLLRKEYTEEAADLFWKRADDLSSFLSRVISKEIRNQNNAHA